MKRRDFIGKSMMAGLAAGYGNKIALPGVDTRSDKKEISIPSQKIPVLTETDVLVCGGGCSGVAAAVSAARHGAKVVMVERWPSVGGMATNALVNIWHRSDRQKVVINGLVEETVQRLQKRNWVQQVSGFPRSHETHFFDPEGLRLVWHQMLREAGVKTYCYLNAGDPIIENNTIKGVLVDTKTGRKAILAKIVIDSTGDGDIAAKAGLPFEFGRASDGLVQGMTMMYTLRGIDMDEKKDITEEQLAGIMEEMKTLRDKGQLPPFNEGNTKVLLSKWKGNFFPWNMCPVSGNPLDEDELTRLTEKSREQVFQYLDYWREKVPGMEQAVVDQTGFSLGIRESRRIKGLKTLDKDMVLNAVKQPDAVGHGVWIIDIHDPKGTGHTTYSDKNEKLMLKEGTSYHIPLGMALNDKISNLAVACRAASSTHEAHASFRVQTHLMVLAQGVGTCAAMALSENKNMKNIDIKKLQSKLKADGVYLEDVPL